MKNREIIDMLVQLDNIMRGFMGDICTEGDRKPMIGYNIGEIHMDESTLVELFGQSIMLNERDRSGYPVEASYTYKGVKFFAIMTRERAKELFGYDAPPALVPDSGGAQ